MRRSALTRHSEGSNRDTFDNDHGLADADDGGGKPRGRTTLRRLSLVGSAVLLLGLSAIMAHDEPTVAGQFQLLPGVPNAETTGVPDGIELTPSGSIVVKEDGTVIDGLDITGRVLVRADDVTIRNTRINAAGSTYGVQLARSVTGLTIEDTEISGSRSAAVSYGEYQAIRLHVHGTRDGLLLGSNTVAVDSFIHDLGRGGEGLKSVGGVNTIVIGNYVVAPTDSTSAALDLQASRRALDQWLIEGNVFEGGRNTVRLTSRGNELTRLAFVDNLWVDGSWTGSPVRANTAPDVWTGNLFTTGGEVPAPGSPAPVLPSSTRPSPPTLAPTTSDVGPPMTTQPVNALVEPDPQQATTTTQAQATTTTQAQATTTTQAQATTTTQAVTTVAPTASTAPLPQPSTACAFTNPNDPKDDPNPIYDGSQGRFPVSANPVPSGYPTPLTTGFCGAGLKVSDLQPSGGITITEDGTVIDGKDIQGAVNIKANNVTIRNSQITSSSHYTVYLYDGFTGLTVEDTRIRAVGVTASTAVYLRGYATFRRVHITGGADVMKAEEGALVEDSYLGATYRKSGSHNDVVQVRTGSNYTFRRNTMLGPWNQTTSVFLFQAKEGAGGGAIKDVLIEGNYLSGGGYTIYTQAVDFPLTGAVVRNNRIEQDSWKFGWKRDSAGATYSGNMVIPS